MYSAVWPASTGKQGHHFCMKTLCRTLILLGLFVASTTVTILVNTLLRTELVYPDDWYIYPLVNAAVLPVTQIVFPLGFLFYLYTFNLFHWRAIKRAASEWRCFRSCCERENVPRVDQTREAATAPVLSSCDSTKCNLLWCATYRGIYWCHHWSWRTTNTFGCRWWYRIWHQTHNQTHATDKSVSRGVICLFRF